LQAFAALLFICSPFRLFAFCTFVLFLVRRVEKFIAAVRLLFSAYFGKKPRRNAATIVFLPSYAKKSLAVLLALLFFNSA